MPSRIPSAPVASSAALSLASLILALPARAAVDVGDKPALEFRSVDGAPISLQKLHGKLVVVDFWATWCGPCMAEAEHMVQLNATYASKGLQMIGISLDADRGQMVQIAREKGFNWPQYFDGQVWQNKLAQTWGVRGIPHTFLIGPEGDVLWHGHPAQIDPVLTRAFKEHPPQLVDPKTLAEAKTLLDQAESALRDNKPSAAIKALAKFPPAAKADEATAARATDAAQQLESWAAGALGEVETLLQQKQFKEAATRLKDLSVGLAGSPSGAKARQRLDALTANPEARAQLDAADREQRSTEALAAAEKLRADNKHEQAYVKFKTITKDFPNTPAAQSAVAAITAYEKDPTLVQRANNAAAEGKAKGMLSMARNYATAGKPDVARKKYQEIIDQFPGTTFAADARKEMAALK